MGIPVFAMVDTNSDPSNIDFPIPANDDKSTSISIIVDVLCRAIEEGNSERKVEKEKETEQEESKPQRKRIFIRNRSAARYEEEEHVADKDDDIEDENFDEEEN